MNVKKLLMTTTLLAGITGVASVNESKVAKADTTDNTQVNTTVDNGFGQGHKENNTVDGDFTVDGSQGTSEKDPDIDNNFGQNEAVDPGFGQGEPSREPLDPNFGQEPGVKPGDQDNNVDNDFTVDGSQGTSEKDPDIDNNFGQNEAVDPGFGQGEPNREPLDPNFGQGEPNREPLDPNFGQGEPNREPLDPNFGQGEPNREPLDPNFGQGEPNKPDQPSDKPSDTNKPSETPSDNTNGTSDVVVTPAGRTEVDAATKANDSVVSPVSTSNGTIQYTNDGRSSIIAAAKESEAGQKVESNNVSDKGSAELLPQTGAKQEYSAVLAGTMLIAAGSMMGLTLVSKRKKA